MSITTAISEAPLESIPPDEASQIEQLVAIHRQIQERSDRLHTPVPRGQHPKGHGCVDAEFVVEPDLPAEFRAGVFAEPRSFRALIRFSNGSSWDDTKADIHGMAIKLLDVPGRKLLEGQEDVPTQDFILIDQPVFFVRNVADYVPLLEVLRELKSPGLSLGKVGALIRLLLSSDYRFKMLRNSRSSPDSPLRIRYWSATPYAIGSQAMKFSTLPDLALVPAPEPSGSKDRYRESMVRHLSQHEARFDFLVQLQGDRAVNPVEDPTVRWDESVAPFRKVATIQVPKQTFDTPERRESCENLSFNPWHALPEHRPLGGVNRARGPLYLAIAQGRHELNHVPMKEPGE